MEKVCNGQESESTNVFEVIGEPAIIINGVPNLTLGCMALIHVDVISDAEADSDPGFGEWLEGRKIEKMFGDHLYSGKVVKYDSETKWYRVVYEDGDSEDLEWHELEEVLLPLDISIPLITLASQRCKSERSVSESRLSIVRTNKSRTKGVRSMQKYTGLLQALPSIESRGVRLAEAAYNCERVWQIQTRSRKAALQTGNCEVSSPKPGENTTRSIKMKKARQRCWSCSKGPEQLRLKVKD